MFIGILRLVFFSVPVEFLTNLFSCFFQKYCDVKLIQTMMLIHEIRTFLEDSVTSFRPGATKADPNSVPLILSGDFNSLPNSGVIEFLSSGRIAADHADFKEIGYKDCLRKLSSTENKNDFTHPFKVARAYSDDVLPYTNFTWVSWVTIVKFAHEFSSLSLSWTIGLTSKVSSIMFSTQSNTCLSWDSWDL